MWRRCPWNFQHAPCPDCTILHPGESKTSKNAYSNNVDKTGLVKHGETVKLHSLKSWRSARFVCRSRFCFATLNLSWNMLQYIVALCGPQLLLSSVFAPNRNVFSTTTPTMMFLSTRWPCDAVMLWHWRVTRTAVHPDEKTEILRVRQQAKRRQQYKWNDCDLGTSHWD